MWNSYDLSQSGPDRLGLIPEVNMAGCSHHQQDAAFRHMILTLNDWHRRRVEALSAGAGASSITDQADPFLQMQIQDDLFPNQRFPSLRPSYRSNEHALVHAMVTTPVLRQVEFSKMRRIVRRPKILQSLPSHTEGKRRTSVSLHSSDDATESETISEQQQQSSGDDYYIKNEMEFDSVSELSDGNEDADTSGTRL